MNIEEKIKNIIEKPINDIGIKLESINYVKENGSYYLRIFIDKEPFVNIDDCVNVTNLVNPILDEYDYIKESYILDISSVEKGEQ